MRFPKRTEPSMFLQKWYVKDWLFLIFVFFLHSPHVFHFGPFSRLVTEALQKMKGKIPEIAGSHISSRVLQVYLFFYLSFYLFIYLFLISIRLSYRLVACSFDCFKFIFVFQLIDLCQALFTSWTRCSIWRAPATFPYSSVQCICCSLSKEDAGQW